MTPFTRPTCLASTAECRWCKIGSNAAARTDGRSKQSGSWQDSAGESKDSIRGDAPLPVRGEVHYPIVHGTRHGWAPARCPAGRRAPAFSVGNVSRGRCHGGGWLDGDGDGRRPIANKEVQAPSSCPRESAPPPLTPRKGPMAGGAVWRSSFSAWTLAWTDDTFKSRLRCCQRPLWFFVKLRGRFGFILRWFARLLFPLPNSRRKPAMPLPLDASPGHEHNR